MTTRTARRCLAGLVALAAAPPAAAAQPTILVGQTLTGTLSASDPQVLSPNRVQTRYDLYRVNLRAGQRVIVVARANGFDPYLQLEHGPMRDGRCLRAAACPADDDGRGPLTSVDAELAFTATADGIHTIRVSDNRALGAGSYALTVRDGSHPSEYRGDLWVDTTAAGTLTGTEPSYPGAGSFHRYRVVLGANQRTRITLEAPFPAYLAVGASADSAATCPAPCVRDLGTAAEPATVLYQSPGRSNYHTVFVAASRSGGGGGAYRLRVESFPAATQGTLVGTLPHRETVTGTLDQRDGVIEGEFFEEWYFQPDFCANLLIRYRFRGSPDTYNLVQIGTGTGSDFQRLEANASYANRDVSMHVRAGTLYTLRVLSRGGAGSYTLRATRAGVCL